MRNYALFAALALVLSGSAALADHAIDMVEPDGEPAITGVTPDVEPADGPAVTGVTREAEPAEDPTITEVTREVEPEEAPAVIGMTREVCTVTDWGLGEVRRECLTEVLPPREPSPALEGICMIKYGLRTCY